MNQESSTTEIPYERFLDCVHCGLCTAACPTYAELGNENDSPRGRIYLMRAVTDGRLELNHEVQRHLELCLDCRACETACPSGVQYGKLIEPFRVAMESSGDGATKKTDDWFHRWILFGMFPYPEKMHKALIPARIAQTLGLDRLLLGTGLWKLLPPRLGRLVSMLPKLGKTPAPLPTELPAKGKTAGSRGVVHGLRGRCHVSRNELGNRACFAGKRLRRRYPAVAGVLRCDSFPFRQQRTSTHLCRHECQRV